jgi:hypothetical protein
MTGTVTIEGNDVVLELHGIDEFLSIKRTFHIPLKEIVSVSTEKVPWNPFKSWKIAGADIPGHIKDGRFLSDEGMMFFEMHDPEKCITLHLNHDRYKTIVFQVEDKEQVASMIQDAIKQGATMNEDPDSWPSEA